MIYLKENGILTNNIIVPKKDQIDELKKLRDMLVHDSINKSSLFIINESFKSSEEQKKNNIWLDCFISDDYMLSALFSIISKINYQNIHYFLEKVSSDYACFVEDIFDKILFQEIFSYKVDDLVIAHRVNNDLGIEDNIDNLLSLTNKAEINSTVLQLAKKINDSK